MRHTGCTGCSVCCPPPPHRLTPNDIINMMKAKHSITLAASTRDGKRLAVCFGVHQATNYYVERNNSEVYSGSCFLEAAEAYNR